MKIDRWDQLYSLNKVINSKKEIMKKQVDTLRKEEEMKGCTFNPFPNKTMTRSKLNLQKRFVKWNDKKIQSNIYLNQLFFRD